MTRNLLVVSIVVLALGATPALAQTPTILFNFDGTAHGAQPYGNLTLRPDGSTLYGMANNGGTFNEGTLFSVPTTGGSPTILFNFDFTHGEYPYGSLTLSGSTLYGMTEAGGVHNDGVIFSMPTSSGTPTVLFSFDGVGHGANPHGALTLSGSTLYGMTGHGGAYGDGVIFSMPTSTATPTILFAFDGAHGQSPIGSLTLSGSTLYGMTEQGGAYGYGTIFSLPTIGGTPTVLFAFDGPNHGANPYGTLTLSGATLYGMTLNGGAVTYGTVFSVPTIGGTPTVLFNFDGPHGANPYYGDLTLVGSTLYGMTSAGGAHGQGALFSISTSGGTPTVLFPFDIIHGQNPYGDLALSGSTLYGMTPGGGTGSAGVIFSLPITLPQYTVTAIQATGGTVTYTPTAGPYYAGTLLTITATPSQGYTFVRWASITGATWDSVNDVAVASTTAAVTANVTLTASFEVSSYTGTEQTIGGGTIVLGSPGPYTYGQQVTITAAADAGWQFADWSLQHLAASTLASTLSPTTTLTVYDDFTLTADWTAITSTLTSVVAPAAGGSVTLNDAASTTGTIGQVIALSATHRAGYAFLGWTVTATDSATVPYFITNFTSSVAGPTSPNTSLTIPDMGSVDQDSNPITDMNLTVTANFTAETFTVTAATSTTWVYQNTPSTTMDRHAVALTISATDTWGNNNYTVTVTQTGPGVVTPTPTQTNSTTTVLVAPTMSLTWTQAAADSMTCYLVGGRVDGWVNSVANLNLTGSCLVTVTVVGDVSTEANSATATVTIYVRPLGDLLNAGPINSLDVNEFVNWLDGHRGDTSTLDPEVFDLDGSGQNVSSLQLNLLILMLDGHVIP